MVRPVVEVAPFRAWEYNPAKADPRAVVSPPYDIVSENDFKDLKKASPYNLVHVTLVPARKKATKKNPDPLLEADQVLARWVSEGVLLPTRDEVVYAYECQYLYRNETRRMRGVLLRLRLDPTYTQVLPHEEIFPKPSEERMRLLRATGVDLEPIQLLYSGKSAEETLWAYVDGSQRPPDLALPGRDGALHKYWRINDAAVIGTVVEGFKGRKAYIADGHHRYAAAVRYAEERRTREYRPSKNAPWEYKMTLFVNAADPGLLILPTHRLVKKAKVHAAAKLIPAWEKDFIVHTLKIVPGQPVTQLTQALEKAVGDHLVGAWLGDPRTAYLLEARLPVVPQEVVPGKSHTYRTLDVVYLQRLALSQAMGVPEKDWGDAVGYTRSDDDAAEAMRSKKAVAVLTHRATRMQQLRAIADGKEKMPQKSTYFLPKTLSGVAMYPIGKAVGPPSKPRITS